MDISPGEISVGTQPKPLEKRFVEFAAVEDQTVSGVRDIISTIHGATAEDLTTFNAHTEADNLTKELSPFYRTVASEAVETFLNNEVTNEQWFQTDGNTDQLLNSLQLDSKTSSIRRIAGGVAIVLSPTEFQSHVATHFYKDGRLITDKQTIVDELSISTEAGFLLDSSEIKSLEGVPPGINVAFILDTNKNGQDFVSKAIQHEEQEILGNVIESQIANNAVVTRLDRLAHQDSTLQPATESEFFKTKGNIALLDLAARLSEGQRYFNLATLGITPEEAKKYTSEVHIIQKIIKGIQQKLQTDDPVYLSQVIHGGIFRPENLLEYLDDKLQNSEKSEDSQDSSGDSTEVQPDDFQGNMLSSEKKGRFVFNQGTLKPGDSISLNNIKYTVERVVGNGGYGVVYRAKGADGQTVAVKEAFIEAPQALFASKATAWAFLEGISTKLQQTTGLPPDPFEVIEELKKIIKPSPPDLYEAQNEFGDQYLMYLDECLRIRFGNQNTSAGTPLYKGNFDFAQFDPTSGSNIIDGIKPAIMTALEQAVLLFPTLTPDQANRVRLKKDYSPQQLRQNLDENLAFFIQESETLQSLKGIQGIAASLGIVRSGVYDEANPRYDNYYMIQEFAEGTKLTDYLQSNNLTPQQKLEFMNKFLGILNQIHSRGIIHKDIKPDNISVDKNGNPVLLDFGIAKSRYEELNVAQITGARSGTTRIGTNVYNSPEHITGTRANSDIYSTGMVLFQMLTGDDIQSTMASFGPMGFEKRREYVTKKLQEVDAYNVRKYPAELESIILKAIAENRGQRYQSAVDMQADLRKINLITKDVHLEQMLQTVLQTNVSLPNASVSNFNLPQRSYEEYLDLMNSSSYTRDTWDKYYAGNWHVGIYQDRQTLFGLPPEIGNYFSYLRETAINNPNKLPQRVTDVLQRLHELQQVKWDDKLKDSPINGIAVVARSVIQTSFDNQVPITDYHLSLLKQLTDPLFILSPIMSREPNRTKEMLAIALDVAHEHSTEVKGDECIITYLDLLDQWRQTGTLDPLLLQSFLSDGIEAVKLKRVAYSSVSNFNLPQRSYEEYLDLMNSSSYTRDTWDKYYAGNWHVGIYQDRQTLFGLPPEYAKYFSILNQLAANPATQDIVLATVEELGKTTYPVDGQARNNEKLNANLRLAADTIIQRYRGRSKRIIM